MISRFDLWRLALSLVSGLALALAFPNYNLTLLAWVSLAGLIFASIGASLPQAALCGFAYGTALYTFSLPWIYTVMRQYGPLPIWEAAAVMALLVIQQSLLCVIFSVALAWIARHSANRALLAAPFLWVAVELLRSRLGPLSFPWDLLGYAVSRNLALVQLTSITGIYGLSFLVAAYNALFVWLLRAAIWRELASPWFANGAHQTPVSSTSKSSGSAPTPPPPTVRPRPWRVLSRPPVAVWVATSLILLAVSEFGGNLVPRTHPTAIAHLVQTDLPTLAEFPANWDAIHSADMAQLDRLSIAAGQKQPGLIVWPEVPAPFSLQQAAFAQRAMGIARESKSDFLLGVVDWKLVGRPAAAGVVSKPAGEIRQAPYNSAALLDPSGREEFLYDKIHLVPFSEYVPGRSLLWFAKDLTALAGDFQHGTRYAVGDLPGGRFGVFICYEAVFPDEVRRFARAGAGLLINISNDGWLGRSSGPAQSLIMARVRAVENRRWLLRDTNNGFTASIDPYGRIDASMPPDVRGELPVAYDFRNDLTFYTRWGDWFAWLCVAVGVCFLF